MGINDSFSMWSVPNKARYFGDANFRYFQWIILLKTYIGSLKLLTALTCWGFNLMKKKINLFCFYIPCNAFVDDDACQLYVQQFLILKNKKIYIFEGEWVVNVWWFSNINSHDIFSKILKVDNEQEYPLYFFSSREMSCKFGVRKCH